MFASTASVPWWSLPAVLAAVLTIVAYRHEGKSVTDAGLAGSKSPLGAIRRGQSARSVAEMAANAAIAMQTQVELQQTEIDSMKLTIANQNDTIAALRRENEDLRELITKTTWGKDIAEQIATNHKQTLEAIASIGAGK